MSQSLVTLGALALLVLAYNAQQQSKRVTPAPVAPPPPRPSSSTPTWGLPSNFQGVPGNIGGALEAGFKAGTTKEAVMTDIGLATAGAGLGGTVGTAVGAGAGAVGGAFFWGIGAVPGAAIGGAVGGGIGTAAGAAAGFGAGIVSNAGVAGLNTFFAS